MSLEHYTQEMPFLGGLLLIGMKTLSAPLGLPGTPFTLLAGSLFGKGWGMVISLIGNVCGASLAFLLSRYVFRDYVIHHILTKYSMMKKYDTRLKEHAFATIITLRLIPLFPFNMLNFLLGVTSVSFKDYFLGTALGIIPGTFVFVYFGESLRMLHPLNIVLAILGIVLLIVGGHLYAKKYEQRN